MKKVMILLALSASLNAGILKDKCMETINCDTDMHCELKEQLCENAVDNYHSTGNPSQYNAVVKWVSSEIQVEVSYASNH
jgi:hypothetical protein